MDDKPRTTNRLEGWHNRWRILSKHNPGFYETVENLQKEQVVTSGEILSILQGLPAPRRSAKEIEKDRRLKNLVKNFGSYKDIQDYLTGVALVLKDY